jgi:hypothetical protein
MLHVAAFYQSVDPGGAFVQLAAIGDSQLSVNSPKIQVPTLNQIVAIAAGVESTTAPIARLVSPSIITLSRMGIRPISTAAAAAVLPTSPHRIMDLRADPLVLVPQEQLTAEINSNPAAAQIQWLLAFFADAPPAPVNGKLFTCRATVANALVAGAWTLNSLTFDDQLPRGRYQIVGLRGESTNMIACRLVVPQQYFRPGVVACQAPADQGHDMFRYGNFGVLGEFEDVDILQVETLGAAADAANIQSYFVDLIQTRSGNA